MSSSIVPSTSLLMHYSDLDDGWMFRDQSGNLCGPYRDKEDAVAAVLLIYGKGAGITTDGAGALNASVGSSYVHFINLTRG